MQCSDFFARDRAARVNPTAQLLWPREKSAGGEESVKQAEHAQQSKGNPTTYMTTSWDDGHPLDLRIAELLANNGLRGTFYIPKRAENETMSATQVRDLSHAFEIGAHTVHHVVLTRVTDQNAREEIVGSKAWVEENTGVPCTMFCPPMGKYAARHLAMVREAGYVGLRGVEMLSLDFPRRTAGLMLMPTTTQAYPHGVVNVARNAIKRGAFQNLWRFVVHGGSTEWPVLAQSLLRQALKRGGVFHLWGHSWELQEPDQWRRLEDALRFMRDLASHAPSLTNGQLCQRFLPSVASPDNPELQGELVESHR